MIRFTYISTGRGIRDAEVDAILATSRRRNRAAGITGMLLFDGVRFLQVLEGEPDPIAETYARIKADTRHRACVRLASDTIAARAFGDWDMAWQMVARAAGRTLAEQVEAMVANVADATLRAQFTSFAGIDRSAA